MDELDDTVLAEPDFDEYDRRFSAEQFEALCAYAASLPPRGGD